MSSQPDSLPAPLPFDFQPRTHLIFGVDSAGRVGELARELGGLRVLVVTDPGIVKAGHARRVETYLREADCRVAVFDRVRENPTTRDVADCLEVARSAGVDLFVAVGGGSAIDTAKGCNFLLTNGGQMRDYWGVGKASQPMLPLIAIPTTAGTGSECQSAALIADENTHQKMACLDPKAAARVAILDPSLTLSQPPGVTAHTGIDAVAHAVETAVTRNRNALSQMFSREAFKLTVQSLGCVLSNPGDLEARGRMLLGAAFAGTAIENSMLGAAHAAANPLTARYGTPHGEAVGIMLPAVVRFNAADPEARGIYAELAGSAGLARVDQGAELGVSALTSRIELLLDAGKIGRSLASLGVHPADIEQLAQEAARQWTSHFNPRPLSVTDFAALYQAAFQPRRMAEHPDGTRRSTRSWA